MSITVGDPNLCPHCKVEMKELKAKSEPDGSHAPQAGDLVRQFACPNCHHVEGRMHRG